jgi:alkylhydroperoxidase/carboxymuconolactone decarboxylase family protein YurZ
VTAAAIFFPRSDRPADLRLNREIIGARDLPPPAWHCAERPGHREGDPFMPAKVPPFTRDFRKSHPEVWEAFNEFAGRCHEAGPLDEKSRRLVKVALCLGAGIEGGTHSAVRNALRGGVTQAELEHIAVLAITTLGFPAAMRGLTWVTDKPRGTKS